jgi:hypothetical protein
MIWEVVRRASAGVQAVISPERYAIHKVMDMQRSMLPQAPSRLSPEHSHRWNALLRFDCDISAAAEKVRPLGERWLDELGQAYFALNEDKQYLPNIINRLTEEAERNKAERWANNFKYTADGELCTEGSLAVLRKAQAQGYSVRVEQNKTFIVTKQGSSGLSFLRSNEDIQRFGRYEKILPVSSNGASMHGWGARDGIPISFREPMSFPKGTTLYKTAGPLVALLPNNSLIVDGGGVGGRVFRCPTEYRGLTGDQETWNTVRDF